MRKWINILLLISIVVPFLTPSMEFLIFPWLGVVGFWFVLNVYFSVDKKE